MPKDRFSKFKKSFYSNEFRYGTDVLFEKNKSLSVKRPKLTDEERKRIKILKNKNLTNWEMEFCNNLIKSEKSLTLKQKQVLINLEKKYNK